MSLTTSYFITNNFTYEEENEETTGGVFGTVVVYSVLTILTCFLNLVFMIVIAANR